MVKICKFLWFVVALTLCLPAMAQVTTGTITGRIVDPQGAVVPGAAVTVTSTTTNVAHAVTTNQAGLYTVPLLLPGSYTVSVAVTGFDKAVQNNLTLQIGQVLETDFSLAVGATTQTVTVNTAAPLIQTESAAVGQVVNAQQIEEVPLNGRQYYTLAALVPGATPPVYNSHLGYRGGMNLGGQFEGATYYTLDGIDNMNFIVDSPSQQASIDDIAEFKVYTGADFEAEWGHGYGGNIAVTSKSGGNAYHGDLYEFIRNQIFDAKNFFQTSGKLSYHRNDFGGTFGGHIIPNKMFFFLSIEDLIQHSQGTQLSSIPDTTLIGGTFPGTLNTPVGYNPAAFVYNAASNTTTIDPTFLTGPANFSDQTLGNTTPAVDETYAYDIGQAMLAVFPKVTASGSNNYLYNDIETENQTTYQLRIDNTYNDKNTSYLTLNKFAGPQEQSVGLHCLSNMPGFNCFIGQNDDVFGGGWTHIFTPNVINNLVAGYQRVYLPVYREPPGGLIPFDNTWNIPNYTNLPGITPLYDNGVPEISIKGYSAAAADNAQRIISNTYDYHDNLLWNHGTHNVTIGFEFLQHLFIGIQGPTPAAPGEFIFNGTYTGNPVADTLLGLPTEALRNNHAQFIDHVQDKYVAGFAEDSWKVTPYLTFNYGLRMEDDVPAVTGNKAGGGFNLATGTAFHYGVDGVPPHMWHNYYAWEPRLGMSYRPFKNDKTVLQAGFGVAAQAISSNTTVGGQDAYPDNSSQDTIGTSATPLLLPDPFPPITEIAGETVFSFNPHFKPALGYSYTLGVQQELTQNIVLTVQFQGQESAHTSQTPNLNQADVDAVPEATAAGGLAARPYPDYAGVDELVGRGHSHYDALYVKLQQNVSHGLSYLIAYTWGKNIDDDGEEGSGAQNIYNFKAERGLAAFDVAHRLVASPVYQLPFGPGRQFLTQGWASKIVGNWEVAGEISLQNGTPMTPELSANVSNDGITSGDRPFSTGNPNAIHHSIHEWFNVLDYNYQNVVSGTPAPNTDEQTNSFPGVTVVPPTPEPFGNSHVGSIQSPGYEDADINIERTFNLIHGMSLQFRGELFDAFNEPQFELPNVKFSGFTKNATTGVVSGSGGFGTVTAANGARNIEFALKLFY